MGQEGCSPRRIGDHRFLVWLVVVGLLITHAVLILDCACQDFATYDEIGNLTAGLSYWETGTYDLYNVNPPIPKLLAALPVWLSASDLSALRMPKYPGHRPEWNVGDQFARKNADRYHELVVQARVIGIAWSVLTGLGVYRWATLLWGVQGGLVALTAWCFEPNVIAHAHLINADLPATAAGLWAAFVYRSYLLRPSWEEAALAGLLLGVALACKFTLLIFCPLWAALWFWLVLVRPSPELPRPSRAVRTAQFILLVGVCLIVVNLSYEFTGTCRPLKEYHFVSTSLAGPQEDWLTDTHGNRFTDGPLGRTIIPLPDNVLHGIDVQRRDFEIYRTRFGYLRGEWKQDGWWYYYLYCAVVKIPLGLWVLFGVSLLLPVLIKVPKRLGWREMLLLTLPAATIFVFVSSQTSIQNHFRYVLPAMPFWIIFLSRAGVVFEFGARWLQLLTSAALGWAIVSYLVIHPHSLAYFNELAGGPDRGHDHLLGSNIDWGQDLLRLKKWQEAHPEARPMKFAYFNHIDPRVIGIEFELPPRGWLARHPPIQPQDSSLVLSRVTTRSAFGLSVGTKPLHRTVAGVIVPSRRTRSPTSIGSVQSLKPAIRSSSTTSAWRKPTPCVPSTGCLCFPPTGRETRPDTCHHEEVDSSLQRAAV